MGVVGRQSYTDTLTEIYFEILRGVNIKPDESNNQLRQVLDDRNNDQLPHHHTRLDSKEQDYPPR